MSTKTIVGGALSATGIGALIGLPLLVSGVGEDIERATDGSDPTPGPGPDAADAKERAKALARAQAGLSRTFLSKQGRGTTGASGGSAPAGAASASKGTTLG